MKLNYWKVQCINDNDNYSIRVRTKKEAIKRLKIADECGTLKSHIDNDGNIEIIKYVIEYDDSFDLMDMFTEAEYHPEWDSEVKKYSYTEAEIRKKF